MDIYYMSLKLLGSFCYISLFHEIVIVSLFCTFCFFFFYLGGSSFSLLGFYCLKVCDLQVRIPTWLFIYERQLMNNHFNQPNPIFLVVLTSSLCTYIAGKILIHQSHLNQSDSYLDGLLAVADIIQYIFIMDTYTSIYERRYQREYLKPSLS